METRWIKFLGTAGARFVMIRQLRSSAGIWYHLDGFHLLVDPGPGTLVRCASSRPRLNPGDLDAILLSHIHIDHSTDINVMIEGMTDGGLKQRGMLLAPTEALQGENRVVLPYLQSAPRKTEILTPGVVIPLSDQWQVHIPPFTHDHGVETYGYILEGPNLRIGHITDTAFFDALFEGYSNVDVLILNVVRLRDDNDRARGILHLNVADAERLIAAIRPQQAILTHFGMTLLKAHPWEVAQQLSQKTGISVIAANDGMRFSLSDMAGNQSHM